MSFWQQVRNVDPATGIPSYPAPILPNPVPVTGAANASVTTGTSVTAKSAHEVLIGVVALAIFLVVAVMLAGISKNSADAILALFVAFLFLQLLFKASVFQQFLSAHPFLG